MKKFSRASREISVTLICILACFFSAFDIAEGIFFQRLLISAGEELAKPAQKRNFLSKSRRFRQICRNRRAKKNICLKWTAGRYNSSMFKHFFVSE